MSMSLAVLAMRLEKRAALPVREGGRGEGERERGSERERERERERLICTKVVLIPKLTHHLAVLI